MLSPSDAITRLHALRLPTPSAALQKLDEVRALTTPMRVFAELFPDDYAASLGAASPLDRALDQFIVLVQQKYFAVLDYALEDRLPGIPIGGYMSIEWWNDSPEDYVSALRLGCALLGAYHSGDEDELWSSLGWLGGPGGPVADPGDLHPDALEHLCAQEDGPATYLLETLQILDHATDNVWLDVSSEQSLELFDWTTENVLSLAEQWREASEAWKHVGELSTWIDERATERVEHLVGLWNASSGLSRNAWREASSDDTERNET